MLDDAKETMCTRALIASFILPLRQGASARCGSEYLWSHPEPVAAFAATNAGEAGANQRIGLCARRYAAVRFRNLGRGRAAGPASDEGRLSPSPSPPPRVPQAIAHYEQSADYYKGEESNRYAMSCTLPKARGLLPDGSRRLRRLLQAGIRWPRSRSRPRR